MIATSAGIFLNLLLAASGYSQATTPACSDALTVNVGAGADAAGIMIAVRNTSTRAILVRWEDLPFSRSGRWTTYSFVLDGVARDGYPHSVNPDPYSPDSLIRIEAGAAHVYGVSAGDLIPDAQVLPSGMLRWQWRAFPYCQQSGELQLP